jgi:hypothetical protein
VRGSFEPAPGKRNGRDPADVPLGLEVEDEPPNPIHSYGGPVPFDTRLEARATASALGIELQMWMAC